jgi:hypothetical protein
MKSTLKTKWLEELPKSPLGTHFLRSLDNKFCALGVLCDIVGVKSVIGSTAHIYSYEQEKFVSFPSGKVLEHLSLPFVIAERVVSLNDKRAPISDLLSFIEKYA